MGKKTATSINSFLKWWAFVIFFSPPFSPSEAEASLMAMEEKNGGYHSPPVDTLYLRFPHITH